MTTDYFNDQRLQTLHALYNDTTLLKQLETKKHRPYLLRAVLLEFPHLASTRIHHTQQRERIIMAAAQYVITLMMFDAMKTRRLFETYTQEKKNTMLRSKVVDLNAYKHQRTTHLSDDTSAPQAAPLLEQTTHTLTNNKAAIDQILKAETALTQLHTKKIELQKTLATIKEDRIILVRFFLKKLGLEKQIPTEKVQAQLTLTPEAPLSVILKNLVTPLKQAMQLTDADLKRLDNEGTWLQERHEHIRHELILVYKIIETHEQQRHILYVNVENNTTQAQEHIETLDRILTPLPEDAAAQLQESNDTLQPNTAASRAHDALQWSQSHPSEEDLPSQQNGAEGAPPCTLPSFIPQTPASFGDNPSSTGNETPTSPESSDFPFSSAPTLTPPWGGGSPDGG